MFRFSDIFVVVDIYGSPRFLHLLIWFCCCLLLLFVINFVIITSLKSFGSGLLNLDGSGLSVEFRAKIYNFSEPTTDEKSLLMRKHQQILKYIENSPKMVLVSLDWCLIIISVYWMYLHLIVTLNDRRLNDWRKHNWFLIIKIGTSSSHHNRHKREQQVGTFSI